MNLTYKKLAKCNGWQPRLKRIKTCNGKLVIDFSDLDNIRAYSYAHWQFLRKSGDIYLFRNTVYSYTTSRHQWTTKFILEKLGIPFVECEGNAYFENLNSILGIKYNKLFELETKAASLLKTKQYKWNIRWLKQDFKKLSREIALLETQTKFAKEYIQSIQENVLTNYMGTLQDKYEARKAAPRLNALRREAEAYA